MIQATPILLGISAGAICILKPYTHSAGTMQPLLCDQSRAGWERGFSFRLSRDSTHQGTGQEKAEKNPALPLP